MNEDLTRQLLRRIAALERRLGIVETSEAGAAHSHSSYLNRDGSVALTADWDIGDGRKLSADTLAARDAAGLSLQDDGANVGVFVKDGGDVGINHDAPLTEFHLTQQAGSGKGVLISGKEQFQEANGDDTHGVWLGLGVSRTNNRQLWIGDYSYLGSSTNGFFRLYSIGTITKMGGVKGDGSAELPLIINENGQPVGIGSGDTPTGRLLVNQASTTGAVPVLILDQADLSEEFIEFTATVGAGNPIDTAAVGTYYGKIRVNVTGVGYKYIALYNT